ncbi:MAG: polymer-forming cytoskeletal protein [Desulfatitalea sp.]
MLGKDKKSSSGDSATISTLLGRDTVIEGTLTFKETIRVDGHISGKLISTDGTVIVGENAVLDADIQVGVAVIRGKINGRVEASQRIEIYAPAQVNGDISAPTVAIDSGVFFNGNCKMQIQVPKPLKGSDKGVKEALPTETTNQKIVKNL